MKTKVNRKQDVVDLGQLIVADPLICHGKPTFKGTRIGLANTGRRGGWPFLGIHLQRAVGRAHSAGKGSGGRKTRTSRLARQARLPAPRIRSEGFVAGSGVNLLDENFPEDQRPLLRDWRVPHHYWQRTQ